MKKSEVRVFQVVYRKVERIINRFIRELLQKLTDPTAPQDEQELIIG